MQRIAMLLLLVILVCTPQQPQAEQPSKTVNIGVLAYEGRDRSIKRWLPTLNYLQQNIPQYRFVLHALTHEEMLQASTKHQLQFILTNPAYYVQFETDHGATRLLTFINQYQQVPLTRFGAVIFTRQQSDIKQLSDLRGKTLAAVRKDAFGGYLLSLEALLQQGLLGKDIDFKWLGFPQKDIVAAVLEGNADAGTVRTGVLEKLIANGAIKSEQIRVLGQQQNKNFPLLHSTNLYPEWPLAQLAETNTELAKQVAIVLLQMPKDSPAAQASYGMGWTIPLDYTEVHRLLRNLNIAPYNTVTNQPDLMERYGKYLLIAAIIFLIVLTSLIMLLRAHRHLQTSQQTLLQERQQHKDTEMLLQQQRTALEKFIAKSTQPLYENHQHLQADLEELIQLEQNKQQEHEEQSPALPDAELARRFIHVTDREHEVLQLVANGDPNKVIAHKLSISPKTVELHRSNLIQKTGAKSSTDLVRLATKAGFIQ